MKLEICPKCTHVLTTPDTCCPHCGVIFAKLAQVLQLAALEGLAAAEQTLMFILQGQQSSFYPHTSPHPPP
jgi:hypothetical protein